MLFSDKDPDNKTSKFNDFQPYKAEVISYGSKAVVSVYLFMWRLWVYVWSHRIFIRWQKSFRDINHISILICSTSKYCKAVYIKINSCLMHVFCKNNLIYILMELINVIKYQFYSFWLLKSKRVPLRHIIIVWFSMLF